MDNLNETPQTDSLFKAYLNYGSLSELINLCYKLERERNHLLDALETVLDSSWDGPLPDYARNNACDVLKKVKGGAK